MFANTTAVLYFWDTRLSRCQAKFLTHYCFSAILLLRIKN